MQSGEFETSDSDLGEHKMKNNFIRKKEKNLLQEITSILW